MSVSLSCVIKEGILSEEEARQGISVVKVTGDFNSDMTGVLKKVTEKSGEDWWLIYWDPSDYTDLTSVIPSGGSLQNSIVIAHDCMTVEDRREKLGALRTLDPRYDAKGERWEILVTNGEYPMSLRNYHVLRVYHKKPSDWEIDVLPVAKDATKWVRYKDGKGGNNVREFVSPPPFPVDVPSTMAY